MTTKDLTQIIETYNLTCCMIHQRGQLKYVYEQSPGDTVELLPINSCTKSFLSALICIAIDRELFPALETPVSEFFPELLHHSSKKRKQAMTVEHLLNMSAGFQWSEFGGSNSFPKMSRTANWIQYVLKLPLADHPGDKWTYNSGVSQMLAWILQEAIEMPINHFAEQQLFKALNIEQYEWESDPQGVHTGGFGMKLKAVDLLSFGLLYLQQGMWQGQQIISADLIQRAVSPTIAAATPPERGYYGWHWWVDTVEIPETSSSLEYFYARGFGGQFVFIIPACEAVVVTMRRKNKKGYFPHDLFRQHIAPYLSHT